MSKQPYTVFEPVGFTEPIPGLRRRPAAARATPIVELVEAGAPRWAATQAPKMTEARQANAAARGRAAPLATGVVLLAMAGAGWAMLQVSNTPVLEIPPLAELSMPAAPSSTEPQRHARSTQLAAAPVVEPTAVPSTEQAPEKKPAAPLVPAPAKPALETTPTKSAALKPTKGDLLKTLPAPAAGPSSPPSLAALPPIPSTMPTSPLAAPAAAPASAPVESKTEVGKPESKPETPAVTPPQPPASAASAAAG